MAESIRKVQYFYVMAPDKPGEGARALATLREAGVNLLAFSGFPAGKRAQLFHAMLRRLGLQLLRRRDPRHQRHVDEDAVVLAFFVPDLPDCF
jgi:hypothetical protein